MRLLCISDIHGHADALAAVLATAERRGYDKILVAGDLLFPGPTPKETWWRLAQSNAVCVQGIGDRALATLDVDDVRARSDHERARLDRLLQTRKELGDLVLERLARMPRTSRLSLPNAGELLLVHGSPSDPTEPISHEMTDEEIFALLGDDPADIVVCGGSHVPFERTIRGAVLGIDGQPVATDRGIQIINVGSVGEALSGETRDPRPGAPRLHADATFVEVTDAAVVVEQFVVPLGRAA